MTVVTLPQEAIDALDDGKTLEIKSPDLGRSGYNGRVTLQPESGEQEPKSWVSVEVMES